MGHGSHRSDAGGNGTAALAGPPPIFVVGVPRSGTTLIFNSFAVRPDLAFFTQHLNHVPALPLVTVLARVSSRMPAARKSIARSDHGQPWRDKLRIGPAEGYPLWRRYLGDRFLYDTLIDASPTESERTEVRSLVRKMIRYQGKDRFATKITGPGRIGFLSSIFPDAYFLHVIRDGRAVARSLLHVEFWRGTWREANVAWHGALDEHDTDRLRECGGSPLALAALQWRGLIRGTRIEAKRLASGRYAEIRYEDFIGDPHQAIDEMGAFCELPPAAEPHEFLDRRVAIDDMNIQWENEFSASDLELLQRLIGDELEELGYHEPGARRPIVRRPFRER
jgi:hypothetical protein